MPKQSRKHAAFSAAMTTYLARQARLEHPEGSFDRAGRWMPSDREEQPCCTEIREPSRSWPYSVQKHCRSLQHVAALYRVDACALRRQVREYVNLAKAG